VRLLFLHHRFRPRGIEPKRQRVVPVSQILVSFLTDSLRLAAEALGWVEVLEQEARLGRVRVVSVRGFYECIHTIKGTALMVDGGKPTVLALESIEGALSCRSLIDSASEPGWVPGARLAIEEVRQGLERLKAESQAKGLQQDARPESLSRGDLRGLRAWLPRTDGSLEEVFYPESWVQDFLPAQQWGARKVWVYEGAWIPVRRSEKLSGASELHAVILEDLQGYRWVQVMARGWTLGSSVGPTGRPLPQGPAWLQSDEAAGGQIAA